MRAFLLLMICTLVLSACAPAPALTPTATLMPTSTATATATLTMTPTTTLTFTPTATATPTLTSTATPEPSPTGTEPGMGEDRGTEARGTDIVVSGVYFKNSLEESVAWFMDPGTRVDPLLGFRKGSTTKDARGYFERQSWYVFTLGTRVIRINVGGEPHLVRTLVVGLLSHKRDRVVSEIPLVMVDRSEFRDGAFVIGVPKTIVRPFMEMSESLPHFQEADYLSGDKIDVEAMVGKELILNIFTRVKSTGCPVCTEYFTGLEQLGRTRDGKIAVSVDEAGIIDSYDPSPWPLVAVIYTINQ